MPSVFRLCFFWGLPIKCNTLDSMQENASISLVSYLPWLPSQGASQSFCYLHCLTDLHFPYCFYALLSWLGCFFQNQKCMCRTKFVCCWHRKKKCFPWDSIWNSMNGLPPLPKENYIVNEFMEKMDTGYKEVLYSSLHSPPAKINLSYH